MLSYSLYGGCLWFKTSKKVLDRVEDFYVMAANLSQIKVYMMEKVTWNKPSYEKTADKFKGLNTLNRERALSLLKKKIPGKRSNLVRWECLCLSFLGSSRETRCWILWRGHLETHTDNKVIKYHKPCVVAVRRYLNLKAKGAQKIYGKTPRKSFPLKKWRS